MTGAPSCDPGGRDAGNAPGHREAVFFQQIGKIFGGFDLLVRQFAETEDGVVDDLRELAPCLDAFDRDGLQFLGAWARLLRFRHLLCQRCTTHQ
jgi:hypothetical protein